MIHVALADDHAVVRAGYRRLLECEADLQVVAEFGDADSTYAGLRALAPALDVLILDLSMPGRSGLDLLQRATLHWPALRIMVFSMHADVAMVRQALALGARAYVTKSSDPALLVDAVRRVAHGERVLSPDVATVVGPGEQPLPAHAALSRRELDVLHLLLQGCSVHVIARRLHLSPKTVANHQTTIRQKLGVSNAVELVRYARQHRLWVE